MMFSPNLPYHLFICAAVMLRPVASSSNTSYDIQEEDFKPYITKCVYPNETIRELSSSGGPAAVCSTSLSHKVVNPRNGTVEFAILLPHNALSEWIYLYAFEPLSTRDPHASCSSNLHGRHSYFQLHELETDCSSDQLMEVIWKANYLYSGCYVVKADLPSPEPDKNCTSQPFYVQTDFKMEPIAYQNLSVTRKTINDTLTIILDNELVLNNDCSNPMISSSCVIINLSSEQQELTFKAVFPNLFSKNNRYVSSKHIQNLNFHLDITTIIRRIKNWTYPRYFQGHSTDGCTQHVCHNLFANFYFGTQLHHNYPKTTIVKLSSNNSYPGKMFACCITSLNCTCDWKRPQLECSFPHLPVGNYCVQVEALDTRCVRDTVWANSSLIKKMNNTEPCFWEICNLEMKNNTGRYIVTHQSARTPISWLVVVFAMAAVGAICISLYVRARRKLVFRSSRTANIPIDDGPCEKLIESPQILLLYARDCPPFMDAMVEFRNLLQRTTGVRVYDIWDNRRREEMDTSGDIWVLNNLSAENTQVIFMMTPISRIFEDCFFNGNKRGYSIPDSRDDIFLAAFHAYIRMTTTHSERCRKFIVARMNSAGCFESIPTRSPCTIYVLPTHLDRLLLHILNAQSTHNSLGGQRFEGPFQRKAEEFDKYVSMHPSYLDSIIK